MAGHAIPAAPANHVPFTGNDLTRMKIVDVASYGNHLAHEFVANCHWNRNRAFGPVIPIVDVQISSADARAQHLNQHVIDAVFRFRNVLQPEPGLRKRLYESLHNEKPTPLSLAIRMSSD